VQLRLNEQISGILCGRRILVVEDEMMLAMLMSTWRANPYTPLHAR
jgi:hypothetical protein